MNTLRARRLVGLALLAYLPALLSAPGRVPGDTKLSLYLDPLRLVTDSIWTWDSRQFSGWVPHQNVGYLWPTGPFYAVFDALSIPDWFAHRLWIGTLLFLAGAGVVRLGRV
ncbi:MAG: alpha-(1-_3)-arabinofuranosyltransferase domain-containing protein, partial [Ilumatobacteraceae bacterium]